MNWRRNVPWLEKARAGPSRVQIPASCVDLVRHVTCQSRIGRISAVAVMRVSRPKPINQYWLSCQQSSLMPGELESLEKRVCRYLRRLNQLSSLLATEGVVTGTKSMLESGVECILSLSDCISLGSIQYPT